MAQDGAGDRMSTLAELCRRSGVQALYVFGSRAHQVRQWLAGVLSALPPSGSDVDIGVKAHPGSLASAWDRVRLQITLEDLLGVSRVDLVLLHEADPFLAVNVIRGERLYAEDAYCADEYELYVLRRAGDLAPLERERIALLLGEAS